MNISTKYNLIFSHEPLYLELLSILKKKFDPPVATILLLSPNVLLACSVTQVSYTASSKDTVKFIKLEHPGDLKCEFQNVKHQGDLELYLRMRISQQSEFAWFK